MRRKTKKSITRKLDKVVADITRSRGYCVKCQKTNYAKGKNSPEKQIIGSFITKTKPYKPNNIE